jgi:putative tricarboxylic transport membrane protein
MLNQTPSLPQYPDKVSLFSTLGNFPMFSSYQKTEIVVCIFLLGCCLFAFISIRHLPTDAKMFPNLILAVMSLFVGVALIRAVMGISQKTQGAKAADWHFFANPKRFIISVIVFSIYLLSIESVGFFTSSGLLIICMATFVGYRNYLHLTLSLIGFLAFVYLVFILVFERPLPKEFFLAATDTCHIALVRYHV